jgi:surfeit locus 1 family protein
MSERSLSLARTVILAAALIGVLVTAALGRWQLGRADEKQTLVDQRLAQAALPPLDGAALGPGTDSAAQRTELLYRPVRLKGRWQAAHTVYLDNRQMQARAGFYVVTPLQLTGSPIVILVQRGWVPRSFTDRQALPPVTTPGDEVEIDAHLAPWPSRMYDFAQVEQGPIRQNLGLKEFRAETGLALLDISAVQAGPASEGLLRDWPQAASGIEKHHAYAFQWFGLSALITLLYVWFQIVQPRRKQKTA